MTMFNPEWLRTFLTVARTQSFTGAASILERRQSTVSEHVRKLELASGVRLLLRDTHSVTLTSDGEAMVGFAVSILDTQSRAMRHFAREDLKGCVRLGVSEDIVLAGLPWVLRRFTVQNPKVALELTVGLSEVVRERHGRGELDLAFIKRSEPAEAGETIFRDALTWTAAPGFQLDRDLPIPLILLAAPAVTRSIALQALERSSERWQLMCTSDSQSGVHAAVAALLGVAPHARSLLPRDLLEFHDERLPSLGTVEFVIMAGREARSGPARALVDMIRSNRWLLWKNRTGMGEAS